MPTSPFSFVGNACCFFELCFCIHNRPVIVFYVMVDLCLHATHSNSDLSVSQRLSSTSTTQQLFFDHCSHAASLPSVCIIRHNMSARLHTLLYHPAQHVTRGAGRTRDPQNATERRTHIASSGTTCLHWWSCVAQ